MATVIIEVTSDIKHNASNELPRQIHLSIEGAHAVLASGKKVLFPHIEALALAYQIEEPSIWKSLGWARYTVAA